MERKNPFQLKEATALPQQRDEPLMVKVVRGNTIESQHRVHAVVVNREKEVSHYWGNQNLLVFPRSSIKLLQALPWVKEGLHKKLNLTGKELALACASHYGEAKHTQLAQEWLNKLNLTVSDLECGSHIPYDTKSAESLILQHQKPCALHNNCSGKHCGMLMACLHNGFPINGYSNFDHPYQEMIRKELELFIESSLGSRWGIDGCGIPTYAFELRLLALAMAKIACPDGLDASTKEAVQTLNLAISEYPEYFGGAESFCTRVVQNSHSRILAKVGAEGVYTAWIQEAGIGIAMKSEDGSYRAVEIALPVVLSRLGYHFPLLHTHFPIHRWTGEIVGRFYCE